MTRRIYVLFHATSSFPARTSIASATLISPYFRPMAASVGPLSLPLSVSLPFSLPLSPSLPLSISLPLSPSLLARMKWMTHGSMLTLSGVVEGVMQSMTNSAVTAAKKKGAPTIHTLSPLSSHLGLTSQFSLLLPSSAGMMHGPYRATTIGGCLVNGMTLTRCSSHSLFDAHPPDPTHLYCFLLGSNPINFQAGESLDSRVESAINGVYEEITSTAKVRVAYALPSREPNPNPNQPGVSCEG